MQSAAGYTSTSHGYPLHSEASSASCAANGLALQTYSKVCAICDEAVGLDPDDSVFKPCQCGFSVCQPCFGYVQEHEGNRCPQCKEIYTQGRGLSFTLGGVEDGASERSSEDSGLCSPLPASPSFFPAAGGPISPPPLHLPPQAGSAAKTQADLELRLIPAGSHHVGPDPPSSEEVLGSNKGLDYGYGSILWRPEVSAKGRIGPDMGAGGGGHGGDMVAGHWRASPQGDESKKPLCRKVPVSNSLVNPYRSLVVLRFLATVAFLGWRFSTPNTDAWGLWLLSVTCELWFAIAWLIHQAPKWSPIMRETFLDRLQLRYEKPDEACELAAIDVFVNTADPSKEPPLVTANALLSILAADYPADKLSCYLSDDAAALLTFETLTETASFARFWVPFCKKYAVEPRCPDEYFKQRKSEYLTDKVHPDFVRERRQMKREYEEFEVRVHALAAKAEERPKDGWKMADGTPWPGNNPHDHVGMIQVFLQPDGDTRDIAGQPLPRLVYLSREKRPGFERNGKAGAMNALLRASALITNAPFVLHLDCDHFVNDSTAFRRAMCFLMDPLKGTPVSFVQFPHHNDGNDCYSARDKFFFDVSCKCLDGVQGPMYVGSGCYFRRQALYGCHAPDHEPQQPKPKEKRHSLWSLLCGLGRKKKPKGSGHSLTDELGEEELALVPTKWHAKRFGVSQSLVTTTLDVDGSVPNLPPQTLLSDVILVISCEYEENTDWGKEIGWLYGSGTEDVVTGFVMHSRGWRSIYALTQRQAFKGTAPQRKMAERLHQILCRSLGSIDFLFSRHSPLWYSRGGGLKFLQRIAYLNIATDPFTAVPLTIYCFLPSFCLLLNQFLIANIDSTAVLFVFFLFLAIFMLAVLEIRWSGVTLEDFWRHEQFWVIGGTSSHLVAVWQGLMRELIGRDVQFLLGKIENTGKGEGEEAEEAKELPPEEPHYFPFKFTWLIVPPITIIIITLLGMVAGVSRVFNEGNPDWMQLAAKLAFAVWVLAHLYPFANGLMGRSQRPPTIVLVWAALLAISLSLLWVRVY